MSRRIANDVEQYKPKRTAVGLLYDMDKIICAERADGVGRTFYFDMAGSLLPDEKIICAA